LTEFQTTKIGDRWFLVFKEGMIPVDSVKEMGFTEDIQRLTTKDGSIRIETLDNEYFVAPVKPSQPQTVRWIAIGGDPSEVTE
jgi:hypothetical protein